MEHIHVHQYDDESSEGSSSSQEEELKGDPKQVTCVKLRLPEHLAAYLEERELNRDMEPLTCDSSLVEKVMSNYIIAKKILSNISWQDKLVCKQVCTTWQSAVNHLARERLIPVDFVFDQSQPAVVISNNNFKKSDIFNNEPLVVLTFLNFQAINVTMECRKIFPRVCVPPCPDTTHIVMDMIYQQVCAPKNCMLSVITAGLTFRPLDMSETDKNSLPVAMPRRPYYCGVAIPQIPGVQFHALNIRQREKNTMDLREDFYDVVEKLAQDNIFKGVLVFVTDKYILQSVDDIKLLKYFKELQPDIPYALGGCIVEDTMYGQKDMDVLIEQVCNFHDFVSENLISIGVFTVPKNSDLPDHRDSNFEMFSLVIESTDWTSEKIQDSIKEFAKKVPQFEHSVAIKLSCVGRDRKHLMESDFFRMEFPNTRIIGCYGNGELGVNHPLRPSPPQPPHLAKRQKHDTKHPDLMYSYSTVFVYIGWGKQTTPEAGPSGKST